jgi:hypothetical protein
LVHCSPALATGSAGDLTHKSVDALSEDTQNLVDLFNLQARDSFQLATEGGACDFFFFFVR